MKCKLRLLFLVTTSLCFAIFIFAFSLSYNGNFRPFAYDYNENMMSSSQSFQRPPFRFDMEPWIVKPGPCDKMECIYQQNTRWTMVNFIKSKVGNFANRDSLRRTWATSRWINGASFRTIFVVAKPLPEFEKRLQRESKIFGDILQIGVPDGDRYAALRTLAGMQWASNRLPGKFFYSSGNDDTEVDVTRLKGVVENVLKLVTAQQWPEFPIACVHKVLQGQAPVRTENGSLRFAPGVHYRWPYYPKFCHGGFYTTSVAVVKQLFEASTRERYLHADDVWITGILRAKIMMPDQLILGVSGPPITFRKPEDVESNSSEKF